ncbi:phasin family protein [Hahella sp. KA22]|uniref:phasin family protein n=2 Tax=Hahella TaxID=158481 RepID=UPI000FDEAA56|nr:MULTISPECIES: phasin family protein [unclassified Hahella]AZZ91707.1 phasin family protein [Hahella sp. KA22]MDG9667302.1 phasin family protein [Hahella sp. CR1]QAY55077.1 phasin family protein [Hahella sp. KA22]
MQSYFGNFADQAKHMYEPVGKIGSLVVSNLERVAEFQMDAAKSYADLTMKQWKDIADIKDVESLKNFAAGQAELASEISKKWVEDMKVLGDMGIEFKDEVEKILATSRNGADKPAGKTGA